MMTATTRPNAEPSTRRSYSVQPAGMLAKWSTGDGTVLSALLRLCAGYVAGGSGGADQWCAGGGG